MSEESFGIGIYQPRTAENVGILWRTAYQLGAECVFIVGGTYKRSVTDVYNTPKNIPMQTYATVRDLWHAIPTNIELVGVEMGGKNLHEYSHPRRAWYLMGSEKDGLPVDALLFCDEVVSIEAVRQPSYNVAVAGSIVMYNRWEYWRAK